MSARESWRLADPSDVPALCLLINSAYRGDSSRKGWTTEADLLGGQRTDEAALLEKILMGGQVFILYMRNGELVGCVFLEKKSDRAYLGMLTVRPELQAAGIGRRLLEVAEAWVFKNWKLGLIEMSVIQKRQKLISWYGRRGYHNSGRVGAFPYGDPRFGEPKVQDLQFVILEKALSPPTEPRP